MICKLILIAGVYLNPCNINALKPAYDEDMWASTPLELNINACVVEFSGTAASKYDDGSLRVEAACQTIAEEMEETK